MTEQPLNLPGDLSLLLYGDTGHGKSTLIAQLAVELAKQGKRTAVFLADKGSLKPFKLLAKHSVVDLYRPQGNAWLWVHHALRGEVRNAQGKYQSVLALEPHTGLIVHEGLTAYAELLMSGLAEMSANGTNVGGEGAWNITIREDKDTLKLGTSNRAHYGAVQTGGKYHLHLSPHADPQLGPRTVALSNARLPLQGGSVTVPPSIEPASLVKALRILQAREDAAERELITQLKKEKA